MGVVSIKELLEAGVHFGHQTNRWNPKMKKFLFGERNGIYIIDLQQTLTRMEQAYAFVRDTVAAGQSVLFVGTKRQAAEILQEEALRANMFFVNQRWLGGMLTNFQTIRKSIDKMKKLGAKLADPSQYGLKKKEITKDAEGDREAREISERHQGHARGSRSRIRTRHSHRAHCRAGSEPVGDPRDRDPRLELRSGPRHLPDPWKRRRHSFHQAHHVSHCRRLH